MSTRYLVWNESEPNDSFYVEAETFEDALHDALGELGWLIGEAGDVAEDEQDEDLFREFYTEFEEDE